MWLEKCLGRIWLKTPGILFGLAGVSGLNFQIAYLPASHNHFRALSLKRQNQRDIKTRLSLFLAYVAFGFFNSPNTGGFLTHII
ncbi:hypothetical protein L3X38_018714 [Prunus dulcis]|uniref:Uncharacterized protein n=1 Tax=Prunus dulcis TaxID=3755 RepID=A0AAD4ZAC4_PRUDU|nr:hypothetical protein L3X38_018714 [Prunus dulcis]